MFGGDGKEASGGQRGKEKANRTERQTKESIHCIGKLKKKKDVGIGGKASIELIKDRNLIVSQSINGSCVNKKFVVISVVYT